MSDEQTIYRVIKDENNPFVMINKKTLENTALSWKAKGLLAYMLTRPDNWEFNMAHLIKQSEDGEHATRTALKELETAGHISRTAFRDESKRFTRFIYTVFERPEQNPEYKPLSENQEMDKPLCGNPQVENPHVENRHVNNKELTKKELMCADAQPTRQKPEKRGDLIDGMLHYARLAADPANAMKMRIAEYPADVQDTLSTLSELYDWPVGSIPERPKSGHGGKYAQWIMELREINTIIAGYGREALEASVAQCERLSISHPAGITWCLAGEIGKLTKRAKFTPKGVDTALTRQLENFTPRKPAEARTQPSA